MVTKEYKEMIKELKEAGEYKRPVLAEEIVGRKIGGVVRKITKRIDKPGAGYKEVRRLGTHLLGTLTGAPVTKGVLKKRDRGRGRPRGTYKARVLPSGRIVKVPTHIYKKMLAAEKAQIRLARVQRQMQAEQLAMQQDMRYQPDLEEEQFLAGAEPDRMEELMRAQQAEIGEIPRPTIGKRIVKGVGDFARGISRIGRPRQIVDEFGRPIEPLVRRPVGMEVRREPRVTAISDKANILNAPNIFNNPGQSTILWNRRRYI